MFFSNDLGIDLGTANTLVFVKGKGIIVNEPSVVALNQETKDVLAVGDEAKQMIGRTPGNITAIRPMKDGVIADFETTHSMLKYFFKRAFKKKLFGGKPRVVICVPSGVTAVEKRAVKDAAVQAGASERACFLIEEPMAAAIGANLPVGEPTGSMIVDIGGGTTEVAVISLGGVVTSRSLRVAGDDLDEHIVLYIKKAYNLMIGERTAENIKMNIGYAMVDDEHQDDVVQVRGRDLVTGLPKTIELTCKEVSEAINDPINAIVDVIKYTLEKTPPELSADIMETGITLAGGGALLKNLDKLIHMETGMPVYIAEEPLNCVAMGTGMVLDQIDVLKSVIIR